MNAHTLKVLEYSEVLLRLASHAQSGPGKQRVFDLRPRQEEATVREECALTAEALELLEHTSPDLGQVTDISPVLKKLRMEGAVLDPGQILSLYANQAAVRVSRAALRDPDLGLSRLAALAASMTQLETWEKQVKVSISDSGEILDTASPGLRAARKRYRQLRGTVVERLERFIRGPSVSRVIQEPFVTSRNGRYVVPAKGEYHREFEGVVQDSSQSGQTLFVEPLFAVGLNNELAESENLVEEEIRKVLLSLSDEVRGHREVLAANLETLAGLDLVQAKAKFGRSLGGIFPVFDPEQTDLRGAKHPLLELDRGTECVPIDIGVGGEKPILVITGPNTGGKTVALKTLGLITLMVQSGLPAPARIGSRIRVFSRIFADIGDEQSLSQNLSTYSGHVRILAGILLDADEKTLVLIDELGAGTDPQEGSALGVALMEVLQERKTCSVVTTHHNLLKDFAFRSGAARNASTLFDIETLRPTYALRVGSAGRSYALEIALRLGLDERVVARAREIIGAGGAKMDELLGRLGEEIDREEAARRRAEEAAVEMETARERQTRRQERYRQEIGQIREKARKQARDLLREVERKGREILKNLPREDRESSRETFRRGLTEMRAQVNREVPAPKPPGGGGTVELGGEVRILPLGVHGKVEGFSAGNRVAEVVCGGIRMKVPVKELVPVGEGKSVTASAVGGGGVVYDGTRDVLPEIRLLGKTVPDALDAVEHFLDRSLMGSFQTLRIVHGGGTGALKKAIRSALREDPRVSSFGPAPVNEGGEGVTVVQLKD